MKDGAITQALEALEEVEGTLLSHREYGSAYTISEAHTELKAFADEASKYEEWGEMEADDAFGLAKHLLSGLEESDT